MTHSPAPALRSDEAPTSRTLPRPAPGTAPIAILFLCLLTGMLAQGGALLNDPDTQWHIAVGRWIVAHGAAPRTDFYSHTFAGQPWIAKEWASQTLLYGAHAAAGWKGVSTLTALVVAASLTWLHVWLSARLRGTTALVAVLVAFLVLAPHILARPHIFTVPVLIAWMIGLVDALERRAGPPWLLIPLMAAWANLHGSYPIGLVLAGILAGEAVFGRPRAERVAAALRWALFLGACAVAALATPYGILTLLVNIGLWGSGESIGFIVEWQPLALDAPGVAALCAFAIYFSALAARPRENVFRLLALTLLGAMMIRHSRFADLLILAAPILAAAPATRLFPRLGAGPRAADRPRDWIALAAAAVATVGVAALTSPRPAARVAPEAALRAAQERRLAGPVYNDYSFGGFLIAEGVPTFIDGRSDQLFLGGFMTRLYSAVDDPDGGAAFAELIRRHKVTWAIVRKDAGDARHFRAMPGWALLREDDVAALFYDVGRQLPAP